MEFPWFNRQPTRLPWIPYVNLLRWAGRLAGRYDTAVVLRFDHWWGAWLAAQAGIAGRIGYDVPEVAPFITRRRGFTHCHAVLQNIDLVEALVDRDVVGHTPQELPLSLELKPEDEEEARRILAHAGLNDSRPLIAIHPGAGASDKLWTPGAWAELADALVELGAAVALTGSATELPLVTQVGEHSRSQPAVLAGRTSLGGLAAVFRRCDVVIGPDTGPLHLAVAVGTPTVHRWGPYDQTIFGPWGPADRHRVVKPSGEDGRDIQALLQGAEACSSRLR
jgi:heptosyltransferase-2/heptosyltransferase-3